MAKYRHHAELVAMSLCIACGAAHEPTKSAAAPVVTRAHGDEASLASVTLKPEAVERLGIALAPVERRSVVVRLRLPGEVVAPPGRTVMLAAPVPGLIVAPDGLPRAGAVVTRGQALARITPLAAVDRDMRAQARSSLAAAEARLVAGTSRAQRAEKLISSGAGSERAAEDARAERDIAAAAVVAARPDCE